MKDFTPPFEGWCALSDAFGFRWPEVFDDFLFLAHAWRQLVPEETFSAAQRVLSKYSGDLRDHEAREEFFDCFDDPRKHDKRSRYIPKRTRERILGSGKCAVCGSTTDLSVDHKRPFSKGGSHHHGNLQALCKTCNSSKGARSMEEWRG